MSSRGQNVLTAGIRVMKRIPSMLRSQACQTGGAGLYGNCEDVNCFLSVHHLLSKHPFKHFEDAICSLIYELHCEAAQNKRMGISHVEHNRAAASSTIHQKSMDCGQRDVTVGSLTVKPIHHQSNESSEKKLFQRPKTS